VLARVRVVGRPKVIYSNSYMKSLLEGLEALYTRYNKKKYIHPDPLEFLHLVSDIRDREIVGLISACLAYGRVSQILKSISTCLEIMDMRPRAFLIENSRRDIAAKFKDFNYRFTRSHEIVSFLLGIKTMLERYHSIEAAFESSRLGSSGQKSWPMLIQKLSGFVSLFLNLADMEKSYLLPDPQKGSACKRLFLYLRWMVRKDDVDPGGWVCINPSHLLVPLDTHMFHIARDLGLTKRKQANLKCAIEITETFKQINPEDPVKYDFVLTRFGIRNELSRHDIPNLVL